MRRVLHFAWQNFSRNLGLSLMTIVFVVLAVVSMSVVSITKELLNQASQRLQDQVAIHASFQPGVGEKQVKSLADHLSSIKDVRSVTVVTAEEALQSFLDRHQDNPELISSIKSLPVNPLGGGLVIKAVQPSIYQLVLTELDSPQYAAIIHDKDFDDFREVLDALDSKVNQPLTRFGLALTILFSVIAAAVIYNALRLVIYAQREEVAIMKLVGADNMFIKMPYVIQTLGMTIIGFIVGLLILYPAVVFFNPSITRFLDLPGFDLLNHLLVNSWRLFGWQLLLVLLLSAGSCLLALRRYLKV
ncbi:MAG: permease-like cell division protein FtsX [bacterium]